jgi:hypothetical protein
MELKDYQKRDAHIVEYLNYMVKKFEAIVIKYPNAFEENIKRKAYKDILFKMAKEQIKWRQENSSELKSLQLKSLFAERKKIEEEIFKIDNMALINYELEQLQK